MQAQRPKGLQANLEMLTCPALHPTQDGVPQVRVTPALAGGARENGVHIVPMSFGSMTYKIVFKQSLRLVMYMHLFEWQPANGVVYLLIACSEAPDWPE